jgi:carbon monoxide dehydrogenase subunit G
MANLSFFESRHGTLSCNAEEVYAFITDIRNFERFVKKETLTNWNAEREFCSFSVSMMGTVTVRIAEKEVFNKVVYEGDALKKNDFSLSLTMIDNIKNKADINVVLSADLNPMMKMMAKKPIEQFLEKLIEEMEKFREWNDIR